MSEKEKYIEGLRAKARQKLSAADKSEPYERVACLAEKATLADIANEIEGMDVTWVPKQSKGDKQ